MKILGVTKKKNKKYKVVPSGVYDLSLWKTERGRKDSFRMIFRVINNDEYSGSFVTLADWPDFIDGGKGFNLNKDSVMYEAFVALSDGKSLKDKDPDDFIGKTIKAKVEIVSKNGKEFSNIVAISNKKVKNEDIEDNNETENKNNVVDTEDDDW